MAYTPAHFTVWTEIPVIDMDRAQAFYASVCDMEFIMDDNSPNPVAMFKTVDFENGISGHLYPGKPAADGAGPTVHLATPGKLEDTLERVKTAGGQVVSDIITIPPGRFAYCTDLDGNSIGCFETDA